MKYYYFNYYQKFKCIANKCKHSCCMLWDIDIDKKTLKKYKALKSGDNSFDNKIDYNLSKFNKQGVRCAFLDKDNLCDIIKRYGEESLCKVCKDHPRFRNFFSGATETGLGLCCEEAGRIILGETEKQALVLDRKTLGRKNTPFNKKVISFRDNLIKLAQDRDIGFSERLEKIKGISGLNENCDMAELKSLLISLPKLDDAFTEKLKNAKDDKTNIPDIYLEQLLCYFIYRHVSSAIDITDLYIKTAFSYLSVEIIKSIFNGECDENKDVLNTLIESARAYSSEIEYSEENLNALYDFCERNINLLKIERID